MHSCRSDIGLRLEPVYFFLLHPGTNIVLLDFLLARPMLPAKAPYSFEWNHNRFSFHLLKNGTLRSIRLLVCSPIQSWLVHCSTDVSSWDSMLARPMLQAKTPCLLSQCFRQRLLAWFGSHRVPRSGGPSLRHHRNPCTKRIHCLVLLAYLSSPIHGIALWPAAIITTIAPRLILLSNDVQRKFARVRRKLFESWKLCIRRKLFESWKLCIRRKLFKSWKLCLWTPH